MEEPQRSIVNAEYEKIRVGWRDMIARTQENLKAGADPMDIVAAEGMFLVGQENQSIENLAFLVGCLAVQAAQESPRTKGARKAAVPAKRRKVAAKVTDIPDSNATSEAIDAKLLEGDDV